MALSGDDEIAGACELLDQAASAIESLREVSDAFDGMAEQAEEVRLLAADPVSYTHLYPEKYHGVSKFDRVTGAPLAAKKDVYKRQSCRRTCRVTS